MAKLAFTTTVIFVLFAFTDARIPLDRMESDVAEVGSDPKTAFSTIFLPSDRQKVESEAIPAKEWELKTTESEGSESEKSAVESSEESNEKVKVDSVPLTVVTFRPFNHRFPNRPFSFPFRHGRPCHHHHRFHQFRSQAQADLSNDMIVDADSDHQDGKLKRDVSDDMMLSGYNMRLQREFGADTNRNPGRWMRFRHEEHRFPQRHEVVGFEEEEKPHHHHHHRHHHHQDHHDDDEEEKGESEEYHKHRHHDDEKDHKGGFMRKIRKFLNHL